MDEMTRRDLDMMKLMSSPQMDIEVFGRSETYRIMCENKECLRFGFEKEACPEVIAYWEEKGLHKELHDADPDKPWKKWASYLPMNYMRTGQGKYPLLFVLHGAGNPIFLAETYGYTNIAAREQMIVIIPEDETPQSIERLLDYAYAHYPVDAKRVYMVGYSLGGFMTSRHALRWPEKFAAVGVGGMLYANGEADDHEQAGLVWPGETTTVEMAKRAAEYTIPVCNCMGEYEVLGLIPVTRQFPFDLIDDVMDLHQVFSGVHLRVERREALARSVVVDDQIVHAQDLGIGKNDPPDLIDGILLRRFAQQRVDGLTDQADTGPEDEKRNDAAHGSVQLQSGEPVQQHADDDDDAGDHIVSVIRSRGDHRQRPDVFPRGDGKKG